MDAISKSFAHAAAAFVVLSLSIEAGNIGAFKVGTPNSSTPKAAICGATHASDSLPPSRAKHKLARVRLMKRHALNEIETS